MLLLDNSCFNLREEQIELLFATAEVLRSPIILFLVLSIVGIVAAIAFVVLLVQHFRSKK